MMSSCYLTGSVFSARRLSEKINDFLPTLLLWTLSALLPIAVAYSDWWMGHWRRSAENLWIMRKVFFYLLFMVLILPSVGFTTLRGLVEFLGRSGQFSNSNSTVQWSCIFLPDNGAFFVNYVITSSMTGTALEFLRFSELLMYALRLCVARSKAEVDSVQKANLYEYPFGFNYGWMLLIFTMTAVYSVTCPIVTPFGLFYLLMKHGVDRYNLYYAYKPSKISKQTHADAVNFVIIGLLLQQLVLLFFNIIRIQQTDQAPIVFSPRAIFSMTFIVLFAVLFLGQIFFHVFLGISPIQHVRASGHSSVAGGGRIGSRAAATVITLEPEDGARRVGVQAGDDLGDGGFGGNGIGTAGGNLSDIRTGIWGRSRYYVPRVLKRKLRLERFNGHKGRRHNRVDVDASDDEDYPEDGALGPDDLTGYEEQEAGRGGGRRRHEGEIGEASTTSTTGRVL